MDRGKWNIAQLHLHICTWQNGKGKSVLFWYFPCDHQQTSFTFYFYIGTVKYRFLLLPLLRCMNVKSSHVKLEGIYVWVLKYWTIHCEPDLNHPGTWNVLNNLGSDRIRCSNFSGLIIYNYVDEFWMREELVTIVALNVYKEIIVCHFETFLKDYFTMPGRRELRRKFLEDFNSARKEVDNLGKYLLLCIR